MQYCGKLMFFYTDMTFDELKNAKKQNKNKQRRRQQQQKSKKLNPGRPTGVALLNHSTMKCE